MPPISIKLETNYNKKLDCPRFLHIDLAPRGQVTESMAATSIIEISTKDNSHEPILTKMEDLCRLELRQMNSAFTWSSHGMSCEEYTQFIKEIIPDITPETKMAIYFYRRISA